MSSLGHTPNSNKRQSSENLSPVPTKRDNVLSKIKNSTISLCQSRGSYKVQYWLNVTSKKNLSLRVSTVSGINNAKVCQSYTPVQGKENIYTYTYKPGPEFQLLYEINLKETIDSDNHLSQFGAEAYSYLISSLWEYQHGCDPEKHLPLYENSKNTKDCHHARHWENNTKFGQILDELLHMDSFKIVISKELHKVFDKLEITYHSFYQLECNRQSLEQFVNDPNRSALYSPKINPRSLLKIESFSCRVCGLKYQRSIDLNHHITKEHPNEPKLTCDMLYPVCIS